MKEIKNIKVEGGKRTAGQIIKTARKLFSELGYANTPIEEINKNISDALSKGHAGIGGDRAGPQWFRGLARDSEASLKEYLDNMLPKKKAAHVVIGHTVSPNGVQPRCGGRVIMIDVGMSAAYGGPAACLVIENGRFYSLTNGNVVEIPVEKGPQKDS